MTADIVIKTAEKENVLMIHKNAIQKNGKPKVIVHDNGKTEERAVEIGLEGEGNMVEIISGLSEGDEVVIR